MGTKGNAILAAALDYAKRGWRVFPILAITPSGGCECGTDCDRAGKHPAVTGWPKEATTDVKRIREWWSTRPDRGIGIATGKESGITVLDVDGETGVTELGKLHGGNGMPPTPCASSREHHYHYYFSYREGVPNKAKILDCEKLDARNDGGYVVAPPSRHSSGGLYRWITAP